MLGLGYTLSAYLEAVISSVQPIDLVQALVKATIFGFLVGAIGCFYGLRTGRGADEEAERAESEFSIIRYIAWAIPSVEFIGTVRGICNALGQAHRAVEGDITGVTQSLGVAFNSTFIALLISIVLMFLIHALQSSQERLVLDVRRYCDDWFVRRLRT